MKKTKLIKDMPASYIACVNLDKYKTAIEKNQDLHQVTLNIASDKLRLYLGEKSKIYTSFSEIDISIQDGKKGERIDSAIKLLDAAILTIENNGLYEDFNLQLLKLNIKNEKNKVRIAVWSLVGGSILTLLATYAKDIGKLVLRLLHL